MTDTVSMQLCDWAHRYHAGDQRAVDECHRAWGDVVRRSVARALWRQVPLCPFDEAVLDAASSAAAEEAEDELVERLVAEVCESLVSVGAALNSQLANRATVRVDPVNTAAVDGGSAQPPQGA